MFVWKQLHWHLEIGTYLAADACLGHYGIVEASGVKFKKNRGSILIIISAWLCLKHLICEQHGYCIPFIVCLTLSFDFNHQFMLQNEQFVSSDISNFVQKRCALQYPALPPFVCMSSSNDRGLNLDLQYVNQFLPIKKKLIESAIHSGKKTLLLYLI